MPWNVVTKGQWCQLCATKTKLDVQPCQLHRWAKPSWSCESHGHGTNSFCHAMYLPTHQVTSVLQLLTRNHKECIVIFWEHIPTFPVALGSRNKISQDQMVRNGGALGCSSTSWHSAGKAENYSGNLHSKKISQVWHSNNQDCFIYVAIWYFLLYAFTLLIFFGIISMLCFCLQSASIVFDSA